MTQFLLFSLASLLTSLVYANPNDARILNYSTASYFPGNACGNIQGSAALSPDAKDLSLLFDNYIIEVGGGTQNSPVMNGMAFKFCTLNMQIQIPAGWQMGLLKSDYRGFASLPDGVSAEHTFGYQFNTYDRRSKSVMTMFSPAPLTGPFEDNYTFSPTLADSQVQWSPCRAGVSVTQLTVALFGKILLPRGLPATTAILTVDSGDHSLRQDFDVAWRQCRP